MNTALNTGTYAVGMNAGAIHTRVSREWAARPSDQRFLDLNSLYAMTRQAADASTSVAVDTREIRVDTRRDDTSGTLALTLPGCSAAVQPTHWSFGQLCQRLQVPAGYLRRLPAFLAGVNLQFGLHNAPGERVQAYLREGDDRVELRAFTGPDYGRIHDHQVVDAVRRIAGSGRGEARWKVPGRIEAGGLHDPEAPVTLASTTLYGSDRDVFMFLVDDRNPIEIGTTRDGRPDLVFRGFYVWNSEVGAKKVGMAAFLLRGVCANRILWGVEDFQEISFRHSKNAPERFLQEAVPALERYANSGGGNVFAGIQRARRTVVAMNDADRDAFLKRCDFTGAEVKAVLAAVQAEEHKPAESVWDFVQGITAVARTIPHQDERVKLERRAATLMAKAAA